MENKILDGKTLSKKIKDNLKKKISILDNPPHLAVVKIGNDPASDIYIKNKEKSCLEIGMNFTKVELDENVSQEEAEQEIIKLNEDPNINGIIIQLPIPKHLDADLLTFNISLNKDVDGLGVTNRTYLNENKPCIIPCTPKGILRLLEEYKIPLEGQHIVIINRSNLVGLPLSKILLQKDATVTICHSKTKNLKEITKSADILISAVGKKHLIDKTYLKENSVIIDVGISRDNNKIFGDVNFEDVIDIVKYITPVPGGIGPMTIAMLLENVYNSKIDTK